MPTFLDLPTEIRIKIYSYILYGISIRPSRKVGWNRPSGDLSSPALLFSNHQILSTLFTSRHFKADSPLLLTVLVSQAKVLVLDHADFAALRRLTELKTTSLSLQSKANIAAARANLRTIDFVDKIDDVLCQPSDAAKLINRLPSLRTVRLTSRFPHRYAGTIDQELQLMQTSVQMGDPLYPLLTFTDGSRMFGHMSVPARMGKSTVVDLSMLVWQHFLYAGAPYRDEWRVAKMLSLLKAAENRLDVIFSFRNIWFKPAAEAHDAHTGRDSAGCKDHWVCTFRAEMNTKDWILRLGHRGGADTYTIRQRREWNNPVSQDDCGKLRKSSI